MSRETNAAPDRAPGLTGHRRLAAVAGLSLAAAAVILLLYNPFAKRPDPGIDALALTAPFDVASEGAGAVAADPPGDMAQCARALLATGIGFVEQPDRDHGEGCALRDTVRIRSSHTTYNIPVVATCPLALALEQFEREVLQPSADRHFGQRVKRINHPGTFACRRMNRRSDGPMSEHAQANAIDMRSFVLEDGTTITVKAHWRAGDARSAFLRDIQIGGCEVFNLGLGPESDVYHQDHFHFDMGPWKVCR